MIRRPPRSTHCISSAASDVYKRQVCFLVGFFLMVFFFALVGAFCVCAVVAVESVVAAPTGTANIVAPKRIAVKRETILPLISQLLSSSEVRHFEYQEIHTPCTLR
eukprot:TRINITY_DN8826_c0_g1_i4.p2 TRINITY_DN8826_c0_g1~~TRINITY_DN8826_c0_g1_i4.p2  ORF type:complete len:106 (+),score=10.71 TRINITY_DN8826_c0_g1_i4:126-443(+)